MRLFEDIKKDLRLKSVYSPNSSQRHPTTIDLNSPRSPTKNTYKYGIKLNKDYRLKQRITKGHSYADIDSIHEAGNSMGRGKKNHWDGPNEGRQARYEKIHRRLYGGERGGRGGGGSGMGDGGGDGGGGGGDGDGDGGGGGGADVDKISKLFFLGLNKSLGRVERH
jgi:hypothetical protein